MYGVPPYRALDDLGPSHQGGHVLLDDGGCGADGCLRASLGLKETERGASLMGSLFVTYPAYDLPSIRKAPRIAGGADYTGLVIGEPDFVVGS